MQIEVYNLQPFKLNNNGGQTNSSMHVEGLNVVQVDARNSLAKLSQKVVRDIVPPPSS